MDDSLVKWNGHKILFTWQGMALCEGGHIYTDVSGLWMSSLNKWFAHNTRVYVATHHGEIVNHSPHILAGLQEAYERYICDLILEEA